MKAIHKLQVALFRGPRYVSSRRAWHLIKRVRLALDLALATDSEKVDDLST
jgi:hypothetical protein